MVASIFASQQPAFRGGGGPVPPVLRSGYSFRIDPRQASTYPGGAFPADGANLTSFADQVTGTIANKTSTNFATYVASAATGLPGIRFAGTRAYTILNANMPPNFYNQANPRNSCQHIVFTALGTNGASAVFLSFDGSAGRIMLNSLQVSDANAGGCGVIVTSPVIAMNINCPDAAGVNVITFDSTDVPVVGSGGTGLTRIFLNGTCIGVTSNYITGLGAARDFIFGALTTAGTGGSAVLTLLDYVYYPDYATPAQVRKDVKALLYPFGKTLPVRNTIKTGSSLTAGTGASAAAYGVVGITNDLLGIGANPQVHNMGVGSMTNIGLAVIQTEVIELMQEIGFNNCQLIIGEGYNTLTGATPSQAISGGGTSGGIGIIGLLRNYIAAGLPVNQIWLEDITGVKTIRGGFASYPPYAAAIANIVTTYPELAGINLITYAGDLNVGLASDATTKAGFYGNTATGSDGAGANSDGYDGLTVGATAGSAGDGVHRYGRTGTLRFGAGTVSGYGIMSDRFLCTPVAAFLGI